MDSSSEEENDLLMLALAKDGKCRKWVHEINTTRLLTGEYHTLMPQLRKDEERFYIYFRMTIGCFDELFSLIAEDIKKQDTNFREAICPEERLAVALRFLATGDTFRTIGHSFRMGFETVSVIVKEVCAATIKKLQPLYLPEPNSNIWEESAKGFENRWQFPNCVGSIDGKHCAIKCPANSGLTFFCYKNMFPVVLLSIVGLHYKFICVDVGGYGKISDGGILDESAMGQRVKSNTLNIPLPKPLPGQNLPTPHCLIDDEAFTLSPFLVKPFPQRKGKQSRRLRKYNYRLCRACGIVENTFGILVQKWRLYNRPLEVSVKSAKEIILATCILHNFLRERNSDARYYEFLDTPEVGESAFRSIVRVPKSSTRYTLQVRERFIDLFNANSSIF